MPELRSKLAIATGLSILLLSSCRPAEPPAADPEPVSPPVVDILVSDFAFEAPSELASGWTTFRMKNVGQQEHFGLLQKLPEGKRIADYGADVGAVFGSVWERYEAGELDREGAGAALGEELPQWFFNDIVQAGGPALTEPGEVAQTTVRLDPGIYVLECYVKTPEGVWHTMLGMVHEIIVTDESNGASPPEADVELTLRSFEVAGAADLPAGTYTIAVNVADRPEGMMAHDINLFRLDGGTTIGEIVGWMDWMALEGFRAPTPGYSLGGVEHMLPGNTGYMTVTLEPGRYAWVSEGYGAQGVAAEFLIE